ncbi:hypothetical protein MTR_2g032980 [Medicago truncatula]|nr:hypothetical protein MTR_2g032980 [Medicago truncatula]
MLNHDSTKKRKIRNQEESNALIQRNVPSSNLNLLTTNKRNTQFEINMMGNMINCNFYIPDATDDNTGLAFRVAYLHIMLFIIKMMQEDAIRTMLGNLDLRTSVINFLMKNFDNSDSQICSLCHYLSFTLSWSGDMRVFTVMNKWLLKTKSPVLSGSRVKFEVDNLEETIKAIATHTYPQYFSHLCVASQLFHLDVSRFLNLFVVALVLEQ